MRLDYMRPGAAMAWTVPGGSSARQIRIVVEEVPDGTWDWTVWETGRHGTSSYGVRANAIGALADAAIAASTLGLASAGNFKGATDAAAVVRPFGFAVVEKTSHGPRLIVGGVCVHSWIGIEFDIEADLMAAEINAGFAATHGEPTQRQS